MSLALKYDMASKNSIDMLQGGLARPMLRFALPLIASGVLQQSFNSVDVAVVGRFAGSEALAAVGSNGPVIGLIINLFLGLSVGANVVIANYIGQRNSRSVSDAVHAAAALAVVSGIIMCALAQIIARPILEALDTPSDCLDQAVLYLRIIGTGMPFMIIYNFGAAILRSVGDTRRPFYSLVVAGVVNVCLNIVFVVGMGMGVAGVAWATVISNVVNAAIVTRILLTERSEIRLRPSAILPQRQQVLKICAVGIPAGLQSTVFSISNVFILSAINSFGVIAAAGSAAALNYEIYCYFVINAFGQTCVAFTSQNFGAGRYDRCRRILFLSLVYSTAVSVVLNAGITWQRDFFLKAFTTEPEVLFFAGERVAAVLLFQFVACYYEMAGSAMRGLGYSMTPALITIFGTCVLRLFWVAFFPAGGSFAALLAIYPVSWLLTDAFMAVAARIVHRRLAAMPDCGMIAEKTS
ncbi:MAG: MATE family efflux transporter [Muribaculaceae bacterium]|nr:MATE family efflux transporter [Muribaculaceae bacterium]